MPETICEACGERNRDDVEFCLSCGTYLGWAERKEAARPTSQGSPTTATDGSSPVGMRLSPTTGDSELMRRLSASVQHEPFHEHPPTPPIDPPPRAAAAPAPPQLTYTALCPVCATSNEPTRRFCAKCGYFFSQPGQAVLNAEPARGSWWRWLLAWRRPPAERIARVAYRRSLPLRYRLVRAAGLVTVLAVIGGGFYALRTNPVSWAQGMLADVMDTVEPVPDVTARAEPSELEELEFPSADAVDGSTATAWRTPWAVDGAPLATCGLGSRAAVLALSFPATVEIRAVEVVVGGPLDTDAAAAHYRPKLLGLQFTNGTCQVVETEDVDEMQRFELEPVSSRDVRVWVLDAWPPAAPGTDGTEVAISEITLLSRP